MSNNIATSGHLVVTAGDTALTYTSEGPGPGGTGAGSDINLEKLYQNTILKSSDKTVSIKGSLIFNKDVTLKADSTIGSLDDEANSPILIPDDLILIDATEFSGSPGKKYVLGFRIGYD